jgi:hypothetical protein
MLNPFPGVTGNQLQTGRLAFFRGIECGNNSTGRNIS